MYVWHMHLFVPMSTGIYHVFTELEILPPVYKIWHEIAYELRGARVEQAKNAATSSACVRSCDQLAFICLRMLITCVADRLKSPIAKHVHGELTGERRSPTVFVGWKNTSNLVCMIGRESAIRSRVEKN